MLDTYIPHAHQIFLIERKRLTYSTQKTSHEITYAITNATAEQLPPALAAQAIRDHWQVENGLHWQKDVRMQEDADRTTTRNAPHNLGALRNTSLTLLRQATAARATIKQRWETIRKQPWRIHKLMFGV